MDPKVVTFATSICCWASICCCCLVAISCSSDSVSSTRWPPTYTNTCRSRRQLLSKVVLMLTSTKAAQQRPCAGSRCLPANAAVVFTVEERKWCAQWAQISGLFCLLLTGSWLDISFPLKLQRLRWHTLGLTFPWKHQRWEASSHKSRIFIPSLLHYLSGDVW